MSVGGVGTGCQTAEYDAKVPIALRRTDGTVREAVYTAPMVKDSELPALLGLQSLMDNRAILDMRTQQLHFLGPGDCELNLPPGTDSYQLEQAPSGHLMLPCSEFSTGTSSGSDRSQSLTQQRELTLVSGQGASSSSSSS